MQIVGTLKTYYTYLDDIRNRDLVVKWFKLFCFHFCDFHVVVFSLSDLGTILDTDRLLEFAKLGVYCQFDLFGTECSYYQLNSEHDMLSDGQRMDKIVALVREGHEDRILMSHDIHTKHRLVHMDSPDSSSTCSNDISSFCISDCIRWTWIWTYNKQRNATLHYQRINR